MRKEYGKERLSNKQSAGRKMAGCFGRELDMGIPSYDGELDKAKLVPLKNKFSWMESSQGEASRVTKGRAD